jgi:ribose transport system permease protein
MTMNQKTFPKIDNAVLIAFGCIVLLLAIGAIAKPGILSVSYLVQQLQVASFLGIIASGMMLVVLMGQIDLSIPWVIAMGGMMATGASDFLGPTLGPELAIPFGILCGLLAGLLNGVGVAYLRAPSMIFTLGMNAVVQGLMVWHTGGFAPQDSATPLMKTLASGQLVPGVPNPLVIWIMLGAATVWMLTRTRPGREIYAIGNKERAVFLSGVDSRKVTLLVFGISGACAAFGGVLLSGWANSSYQAMGDPYLLPTIAAIVLGGTNVMGGRGSYLGTIAGVILITLLQSILSVLQPQDYFAQLGIHLPSDVFRQVVFGLLIIVMMMLYGRERLVR